LKLGVGVEVAYRQQDWSLADRVADGHGVVVVDDIVDDKVENEEVLGQVVVG
jgi:hypothetical protein